MCLFLGWFVVQVGFFCLCKLCAGRWDLVYLTPLCGRVMFFCHLSHIFPSVDHWVVGRETTRKLQKILGSSVPRTHCHQEGGESNQPCSTESNEKPAISKRRAGFLIFKTFRNSFWSQIFCSPSLTKFRDPGSTILLTSKICLRLTKTS